MANPVPSYPQYTNMALEEGLFDQLMTSVKHHLDEEYKANRIRGDLYARTYLGSMEAVMQNTTQYLLGLLLIDEKKLQLDLTNAAQLFTNEQLLPLQRDKLVEEINLLQAQILKIEEETLFIRQKIETELANVDGAGVTADSLLGRQMSLLQAQKYGFAGDIEAKTAKLHADYAAVYQSVQEVTAATTLDTTATAAIDLALTTAATIKGV